MKEFSTEMHKYHEKCANMGENSLNITEIGLYFTILG